VDLADQRAGRVDHPERPSLGLCVYGRAYPVGAEHHESTFRYLAQLVDEFGAAFAEPTDNMSVVDNFLAHVDRRAESLQRQLDDLNGSVDTGAIAPWSCQQQFHNRRVFLTPKRCLSTAGL
jgi:hypothetical protein